jgi:DNA-binding PadR family transcriptional regulator
LGNNNTENPRKKGHKPWQNKPRTSPGLNHAEHVARVQLGLRGFLRPEVIQILEQQPMSGTDIMNRMQEMSHGWYRPSQGSIYPLLFLLEKQGLATKNKEGKYELTAAYYEESSRPADTGQLISAMEKNTTYLEMVQKKDREKLSTYRERIQKLANRLNLLITLIPDAGRVH